jgi:serine/threonine protein phosphatase 1
MGTIAIGDIHGNLRALEDLLNGISKEVGAEDTVVFLGDYIDRGPDSKGCIERIIAFQSDMKANVVPLLGNHEEWLLQTTVTTRVTHGLSGWKRLRRFGATPPQRHRGSKKKPKS